MVWIAMDSRTINSASNPSRDKPAPTTAQPSFRPGSGHEALRRGRWSAPDAEYFLTICTAERGQGLATPRLSESILEVGHRLTAEGHWNLRTGVVMPDHVHLLISLGNNTALSAAIRLFKGRLTPALRSTDLRWERGCFDHRMRTAEDRLPVFRYIFLNPYRANLLSASETWCGYFCATEDWSWFEPLTDAACPFPEWLL
jgi:putative transposase